MNADQQFAQLIVSATARRSARWALLLKVVTRAPLATPDNFAHALARRDAKRRPLVAKVLRRYEKALSKDVAARMDMRDLIT